MTGRGIHALAVLLCVAAGCGAADVERVEVPPPRRQVADRECLERVSALQAQAGLSVGSGGEGQYHWRVRHPRCGPDGSEARIVVELRDDPVVVGTSTDDACSERRYDAVHASVELSSAQQDRLERCVVERLTRDRETGPDLKALLARTGRFWRLGAADGRLTLFYDGYLYVADVAARLEDRFIPLCRHLNARWDETEPMLADDPDRLAQRALAQAGPGLRLDPTDAVLFDLPRGAQPALDVCAQGYAERGMACRKDPACLRENDAWLARCQRPQFRPAACRRVTWTFRTVSVPCDAGTSTSAEATRGDAIVDLFCRTREEER